VQIFWLKILLPVLAAAVCLNPHTPLWLVPVVLSLLLLLYQRRQQLFLIGCLLLLLLNGLVHWRILLPPPAVDEDGSAGYRGRVTQVAPLTWSQRVTLRDVAHLTAEGAHPLTGRYQLFLTDADPVRPGDQLRWQGRRTEIAPPLNRGEPDWRWRGQLAGICGEFRRLQCSEVTAGRLPWPREWQQRLRGRLERYLDGSRLQLLSAMLLGEREQMAADLREDFVRAGVIHLLAVSGLHVGFIAAILLGCLRLLPLPRKLGWLLLPLLLVAYACICGGRPSVVRAVTMATALAWGQALERRVFPIACLLASAALSGLADPLCFFELGFQLSYLAVLSVLLATRCRLSARPFLNRLLQAGLVSLACFCSLAPLLLYHFGQLSPIGILVNLPAIPLAGLITGQGMLLLAMADMPGPATLVAAALSGSLQLLQQLVQAGARLPGAGCLLPQPSLTQLLLWLLALLLLFLPGLRRRGPKLLLLLLATCAWLWLWQPQPGLELAAINVGQGDAIFLQSPGGHRTLIDAGARWGRVDRGRLQVVPYLRRRGVHHLDLIILTHTDLDHLGGMPAVLREIGCDTIYLPESRDHPLFQELLDICREREIVTQTGRAGQILARQPGYRLYLLSPPSGWPGDANDRSLVTKCVYGSCSALLTGDAGRCTEDMLIRIWGGFLRSDLLKAGHHGSAGASSARFLEQVAADRALISAGRGNRYGHPAPAVLERLREAGTDVLRTDREGTLELKGNGENWVRQPPWWRRPLGSVFRSLARLWN